MTEPSPSGPPRDPPRELPKIESLADRTKRFLAELVADWIKLPIAEVGRWLRRRVLLYTVGLVLMCVAIIFVLVGGVHGLQELRVPVWATYLGVGVVAAVAGVIVLTRK